MILEEKIEKLSLNGILTEKLKDKGINIVKDLWQMKRKDLKNLDFSDGEIMQIVIKLQLNALDLNKKVY